VSIYIKEKCFLQKMYVAVPEGNE